MTEAYKRFLINLGEPIQEMMQTDNLINQCIRIGFDNGMTEVETLTAIIYSFKKTADADLETKLNAALYANSVSMTVPPEMIINLPLNNKGGNNE